MKLIANSITASSRQPIIYDNSGVEQASDAYYNLSEGPLHLKWSASGAYRHAVFKQGSNRPSFDIDTAVLFSDISIQGRAIRIYGWSSFSTFGTKTELWNKFNIPNSILTGNNNRILVAQANDSNSFRADWSTGYDALSMNFWYSTPNSSARKVFFGKSIDLGRPGFLNRQPLNRSTTIIKRQSLYHVTDVISLTFNNLDQTAINLLNSVRQLEDRPFFLYDENKEWLFEGCGYFIMQSKNIEWTRNDGYMINIETLKVKEY